MEGGHRIDLDLPGDPEALALKEGSLRAACEILLEEMRGERGDESFHELHLSVISDDAIREVNREHRGKDSATDVLSFPMLDEGHGPDEFIAPGELLLVGDILISHETCAAQAVDIGHSEHDEFLRLLVHGLLHLYGYDHETSAEDEIAMRKREDELLGVLAAKGL